VVVVARQEEDRGWGAMNSTARVGWSGMWVRGMMGDLWEILACGLRHGRRRRTVDGGWMLWDVGG
jgi:hypothetical protein